MNNLLGCFQIIILMAIVHLKNDAHASNIHLKILSFKKNFAQLDYVYVALDRLEKTKYIVSHIGTSTLSDNRRRRFYKITPLGLNALKKTYGAMHKAAKGLNLNRGKNNDL